MNPDAGATGVCAVPNLGTDITKLPAAQNLCIAAIGARWPPRFIR